MKRRLVVLALALTPLASLAGSPAVAAAGASGYVITDIGPTGGTARAYAMSPNGTVVGEMVEANASENVPFIWRGGVTQELALPAGYSSGIALGVNDSGKVVGGVRLPSLEFRAVIWISGVPTIVGPVDSLAFAVNEAGVVVGRSQNRAVRWDGSTAIELGSPSDPPGQAEGINDLGDVVGASTPTSTVVPARWSDGALAALPLPSGDTSGEAYTISSTGVTAGGTTHDSVSRAVLWDALGVHVLPLPGGWENAGASSTNARGYVVGAAWNVTSSTAVIWRAGVPAELKSFVTDAGAWDLTETFQIDDAGRIIGVGSRDGVERGYLLTPRPYGFVGFKQPVDNADLNVATAGQAIPLRFEVLSPDGMPVTDLTSVRLFVRSLTCDSGLTPDQIEEYWVGATGLMNLGGGRYMIGWKTPKSYANSCKVLVLMLDDGVEHTASFSFRQ